MLITSAGLSVSEVQYSLGDGGMLGTSPAAVTFEPLAPGDRGLSSATFLKLLLNVEPIFPSVLAGLLPLLPSDARSSSECWETWSVVSVILFRSGTERRSQTKENNEDEVKRKQKTAFNGGAKLK